MKSWPGLPALREGFADLTIQVAELRQDQEGWTDAETVAIVRATAAQHLEEVRRSLFEAADMALDVWLLTRDRAEVER